MILLILEVVMNGETYFLMMSFLESTQGELVYLRSLLALERRIIFQQNQNLLQRKHYPYAKASLKGLPIFVKNLAILK